MSGSEQCEKCLKNITRGRFPGIKCGMCISMFHIKCVDISNELLDNLKNGSANWLCHDCRSRANSSLIDAADDNIIENSNPHSAKINDVIMILQGIQTQLDSLKSSFNFACQTLDEVKATLSGLTKETQQLDNRLTYLEKRCDEQWEQINLMEAQMDRPKQELNINNLVVCGIPPKYGDIHKVMVEVVNTMGIQITKEDIIETKQMVHDKESVSHLKDSFIVKFKSNDIRNNIMNTFRENKQRFQKEVSAKLSSIGSNQRVYLLHHFTKFQSKLYNAAKKFQNKSNYKFLWCKNNNIYLRKSAETKVHHIMSFNDIHRLICTMEKVSPTCTTNVPISVVSRPAASSSTGQSSSTL